MSGRGVLAIYRTSTARPRREADASKSKRGNRYLRPLFVQAALVESVNVGRKQWKRYGLMSWMEAANKRVHHNVLAIALATKLARHRLGRPQQKARVRIREGLCDGAPQLLSSHVVADRDQQMATRHTFPPYARASGSDRTSTGSH
jgi:hypothetical protein